MRMLDVKLMRDFRRLWAQIAAIALVMASGVATLILATGSYRSLEASRETYYERNRFAHVFASATRAPMTLLDKIAAIPGVLSAEGRILKYALLDVPGLVEPASGLVISLPDERAHSLNRLHLREGRLPEPGRVDEVVVSESFALAHAFSLQSTFGAVLNGRLRTLRVVGVALSPEFIYAIGPGDLMPDDRRFGVVWLSQKALAGLFDLDGAFNSVSLLLLPGADEAEVMHRLDGLLARYGGIGAYGRKDQISHAFIDAELKQLAALARIIPPIFLCVAAFLINITLSRLIAIEREQIGLLKAVGYESREIAWHYVKLVLLVGAAGITIGSLAGSWLGRGLTRLYAAFFHFPVLVFRNDSDVFVLAGGVSCAAAVAGALTSVYKVLALSPATAMQPPAPARYRHVLASWLDPTRSLSHIGIMAFRHMLHRPLRTLLTLLGLALAVSLLVTALLSFDSVEKMVDIAFNQTDRQHATLNFNEAKHRRILEPVAKLPGVLRIEPSRSVAVRLRHGPRTRKVSIIGKPAEMDLSRVLDLDLKPVALPATGLVLGARVAELLDARRGDTIEVEILEGKRTTARVPVTDIIQSYFGLMVFMDLAALDELLDEGPRITSVHLTYDTGEAAALFKAIKRTPAVASIGLQRYALAKFRETIAQNINYMVTVYVVLAVVIAFGVVYNSARIQLSERARELASLRVLGFTRGEVSWVLLTELTILTVACLPLGWVIGYGFGWLLIQSFSSDLYRAPFVIAPATYAKAALVVLTASAVSGFIVRRRVDRLDLIGVLKTRE
ncbi:MAG: ABC transporter permease [Hyphomicrobiaceae bacterium]|nr:MAG: ABC transporter permease [Hyphomicrobiaceae bacterium]